MVIPKKPNINLTRPTNKKSLKIQISGEVDSRK